MKFIAQIQNQAGIDSCRAKKGFFVEQKQAEEWAEHRANRFHSPVTIETELGTLIALVLPRKSSRATP